MIVFSGIQRKVILIRFGGNRESSLDNAVCDVKVLANKVGFSKAEKYPDKKNSVHCSVRFRQHAMVSNTKQFSWNNAFRGMMVNLCHVPQNVWLIIGHVYGSGPIGLYWS